MSPINAAAATPPTTIHCPGVAFAPPSDSFFVRDGWEPDCRPTWAAAGEARVDAFTDLGVVMDVWTEVAEAHGGLGAGVGGHADVAEGSILLALHPERVRPDRVEPGRVGPLDAEVTARLFEHGMAAVSANGVLGDPTGMDAALGRRLIDALADRLVAELGGG